MEAREGKDGIPKSTSNILSSELSHLSPQTSGQLALQNGLPTPKLLDDMTTASSRRMPLTKSMTEGPVRPQQHSRQPLGRGQTQLHNATRIYQDSDSYSDSDSSSTSDGDDPINVPTLNKAKKVRSDQSDGADIARVLSGASHTRSKKHDTTNHRYSRFSIGNDEFKSRGKVSKRDGRLNISVNETAASGYLAKAVGATFSHHACSNRKQHENQDLPGNRSEGYEDANDKRHTSKDSSSTPSMVAKDTVSQPKLNIVVMVIGSRGDIQPFLKIGKILKEQHGHRVRIATHPAFKSFVEKDSKLEFFSVGGDPSELMAFMVKNPGLIPSLATVKAGEIGRRRDQMFEMFQGLWRACINATDDETDIANLKMMGDKHPFVADAIIANPPCFAHIHCAEKLGIPMHLMFTMPWSPTQAFPHPLATVKKSNVDINYVNYISYPLVDMMTWQGLGDLVNRFRVKTLGLEPVSTLWQAGQNTRLHIPFTYLFSPGLVPKPSDWGPEVDVAGFVFLNLADSFTPPESLTEFLEAGPPPIYIGFGSIVVDDPDKFTALIFEAVKKTGVRALVSKGWGGLGDGDVPDSVYMLENTPHDWLFPRVSAVVHHGGAGTTAAALKHGRPSMICSFFGDQAFWGSMVSRAGAGYHKYVPYKRLTVDELVAGITECLSDEALAHAQDIAKAIEEEGDAGQNAVNSFHRRLNFRSSGSLRCSALEDRVANWYPKSYPTIRLSALAADILVEQKKISWRNLRLLRHQEWNDFEGPGEPLTGGGAAILKSVGSTFKGVGGVPVKWAKRVSKTSHKVDVRRKSEDNARLHGEAALALGTSPAGVQDNLAENMAQDTTHGLSISTRAVAKAPMDILLAISQGFHNAPRLYGDSTVRRPIRITGMHSGLHAARNEFGYGVYDGVTGLVTQPYHGAQEQGARGLVGGAAKGVGGFVLKDFAAVIGPLAYTLKGVHSEVRKRTGPNPTAYIRRARILQGEKDWRELGDRAEQKRVVDEVLGLWRRLVKKDVETSRQEQRLWRNARTKKGGAKRKLSTRRSRSIKN